MSEQQRKLVADGIATQAEVESGFENLRICVGDPLGKGMSLQVASDGSFGVRVEIPKGVSRDEFSAIYDPCYAKELESISFLVANQTAWSSEQTATFHRTFDSCVGKESADSAEKEAECAERALTAVQEVSAG